MKRKRLGSLTGALDRDLGREEYIIDGLCQTMPPLPSAWDQSWKTKRRGSVSLYP